MILQISQFKSSLVAISTSLLAILSGTCGLAYETLFIRLFSNYFGDSFVITGVTLCAVFLGMSFGAWQSLRFKRHLGVIELSIGLYAFGAATVFSNWGFDIAAMLNTPWANAALLAILLGFPAFLIGTCVPLFTAYARQGSDDGQAFPRIYALYNLGAFLSVLLIEFVLCRTLGLQLTCYVIGSLNLLIGLTLILRHKTKSEHSEPSAQQAHLQPRIAIALFLASFASGIFQLFVLRLSFSIFGPLHENFAIILASAIVGVAIGTWLSTKRILRFPETPGWIALLTLSLLVFVPALVEIWSYLSGQGLSDILLRFSKVLLLMLFSLPCFVVFGALVPLAVTASESQGPATAAKLLAISSLGNGLGSLVMFVALFRIFELYQLGFGVAAIALGAAVLSDNKLPKQLLKSAIVVAALAFGAVKSWPEVELLLGYRMIAKPEQLKQRLQSYDSAATYKAYDQSASVVHFDDGARSLVFNGYHSLSFGPGGRSDLHEAIVGATPALFVENANKALVLGLGTGISAGAAAQVFDQVNVVEINPAILRVAAHFAIQNFGVLTKPAVKVSLEDGISRLIRSPERYDAIINTVTSPKYYSASKLYTVEFMRIAKSRLSERGVYSTWFDLKLDRDGIAIMLNTLDTSFKHCRFFVLTGAYFNAICADHPLIYASGPRLRERLQGNPFDAAFAKHGFDAGFAETMGAIEVSFDKEHFDRTDSGMNTLDRPLIEFIVTSRTDSAATSKALSQAILSNIEQQRRLSGGRSGWRRNCQAIAQMSYLKFSGCE